jgi:tRNA (guanine-N7-)-methyltransferase
MFPNQAAATKRIEFVDVGCAFGGMLFALAPLFPDTLMLGLEIRPKVVAFAQGKAVEMRRGAREGPSTFHHYNNVWFEQLNVMKYGSNCFECGQLSKLFFCYPDPHWKRKNIRRRIISPGLVQEYAYWLRVGGLLYTVSDVLELEQWMVECLDQCPLFRRLGNEELLTIAPNHTQLMDIVTASSEDAARAARKGLPRNFAVHLRVDVPAPLQQV